eukprot:PhM_4_TR9627/c0_g2_i1/m.13649
MSSSTTILTFFPGSWKRWPRRSSFFSPLPRHGYDPDIVRLEIRRLVHRYGVRVVQRAVVQRMELENDYSDSNVLVVCVEQGWRRSLAVLLDELQLCGVAHVVESLLPIAIRHGHKDIINNMLLSLSLSLSSSSPFIELCFQHCDDEEKLMELLLLSNNNNNNNFGDSILLAASRAFLLGINWIVQNAGVGYILACRDRELLNRTALHFACLYISPFTAHVSRWETILSRLVQIGLDINAQDVHGNTPLHLLCLYSAAPAGRHFSNAIISHMLLLGADTTRIRNNDNKTVRNIATDLIENNQGSTAEEETVAIARRLVYFDAAVGSPMKAAAAITRRTTTTTSSGSGSSKPTTSISSPAYPNLSTDFATLWNATCVKNGLKKEAAGQCVTRNLPNSGVGVKLNDVIVLDASGGYLGDKQCLCLVECLRFCENVQVINLDRCGLSSRAARHFLEHVLAASFACLKVVNLNYNPQITDSTMSKFLSKRNINNNNCLFQLSLIGTNVSAEMQSVVKQSGY